MCPTGSLRASIMCARPALAQLEVPPLNPRHRRFRTASRGFPSHTATPGLEEAGPTKSPTAGPSLRDDILATEHFFTLGSAGALHSALCTAGPLFSDVDESGTSTVCSRMPLASFLGQALQVSMEEPVKPATPLLVITTLARLRFGSPEVAEPYRGLYQRAAGALMEAADRAGVYALADSEVMSEQEVLDYFVGTASLGWVGPVYKGSGFGHLLAHHLRQNRFSAQQLLLLLEAWATLRSRGGYNPCVLNFRQLAQSLVGAAPGLSPEELLRAVTACRQFEWPAYASKTLLEGLCEVTLARATRGELPAAACERILDAAIQSAGHHRPAQAHALRARLAASLAAQLVPRSAVCRLRRADYNPANNAVVGPHRRVAALGGGLLWGLTAALPAAGVLSLPVLPSQWQALASALVLASLAVVVEVDV